MRLEAGLLQQQTLKLAMTQELSQAIALLQYSTYELTSFLEEKAMENPLIKVDSSNVKLLEPHHDNGRKKRNSFQDKQDDKNWLEQISESARTLHDYLFRQLAMTQLTDKQKKIVHEMIYNLDTNGYLTSSLEDIRKQTDASLSEVDACLEFIQQLEPAGVCARSLQECLLLQVKRKKTSHPLVQPILENHFIDFANRKWTQIAKRLSVTVQEIQTAFDEIQLLHPRPGAYFHTEQPQYIVPDLIAGIEDGQLTLRLLERSLPSGHFQTEYYREMSTYQDNQVKEYLKEKVNDYNWIQRSLEQRKNTILKVGFAIMDKQKDFFFKGPAYLNPLTMKDIAEEIGMHESTVSRTVREKYMQTPFGTYELKYFFSTALGTSIVTDDQQTSATRVKMIIKKLIEQEDKRRPLSDQKIADHLEEQGMVISRRTVAKYRDQLYILSSTKRKRFD